RVVVGAGRGVVRAARAEERGARGERERDPRGPLRRGGLQQERGAAGEPVGSDAGGERGGHVLGRQRGAGGQQRPAVRVVAADDARGARAAVEGGLEVVLQER